MEIAINATHNLQNTMQSHTQLASKRNEMLLLDILTPAQTALFLEWKMRNKQQCRSLLHQYIRRGTSSANGGNSQKRAGQTENGSMLTDTCRQLERMRLHKQ